MNALFSALYKLLAIRGSVDIGKRVHVGFGSRIWSANGLTIGSDSYIGKYCTIECDGSIGSGVLIANNVGIVGRDDHDVFLPGYTARNAPWVGDPLFKTSGKRLRVEIGNDVWVGFGAIVLTGVKVERGAIIAAGAVVTRDVSPYAIVAGNPATQVGLRFGDDMIAVHEAMLQSSSLAQ